MTITIEDLRLLADRFGKRYAHFSKEKLMAEWDGLPEEKQAAQLEILAKIMATKGAP